MTPATRLPIVLLTAVVLHTSVLPHLRLFGVAADVLLLLALATGLVAGPERGAVAGFVAGVLADAFLQTPFGLSALAYCLAGWSIGCFRSRSLHISWWVPAVTVAVGAAGGTLLYVSLGVLVGQEQLLSGRMPRVVAVVALTAAALSPLAIRTMRWGLVAEHRRRLLPR